MRLTLEHTFHGPSPWADEPAIVLALHSDDRQDADPNADSRLQALRRLGLPMDLAKAQASPQLHAGTAVAELTRWMLNEVRGDIRVAACHSRDDGLWLVVGHHHPQVSLLAARTATRLWEAALRITPAQLSQALEPVWAACRRLHPDYQAQILMTAARAADVPYLPFIPRSKLWQFGWGTRGRVFIESASNADGYVATQISKDKALSKRVFRALGIPTPASVVVSDDKNWTGALQVIGYPCVVKPLDRGGGKGVSANIRTPEHLKQAVSNARQYTRGALLLEQFIPGDDHRLMTVDGRFVAAIRREPCRLLGDGKQTVQQLVEAANANRSMSLRRSGYLRPIVLDTASRAHLMAQGVDAATVLAAGRAVSVRGNANLSTGGVCIDVTQQVHPDICRMVEQLAQATGLGTAGFDYLTTDITQPPCVTGGAFIEVNATPGLDATVAAGWSAERIGTAVLGTTVGRIPVSLHLLDDADALQQARTALASHTHEARTTVVTEAELHSQGLTMQVPLDEPWAAVNAALRNRQTQTLVVLCRVAELMKHGLPVDRLQCTTLARQPLPPVWLALLERRSDQLHPAP